jgi:hypothetical protein
MKYLMLFEQFTSHNYKPSTGGMSKLSLNRSKGSVNWFTRYEINMIRERADQLGVPKVHQKSDGHSWSFFGESNGFGGLVDSTIDFFKRGENLCNTVSINTKRGDYQLVKRAGEFRLNGKNVGSDVMSALKIMM